MVLRLAPRSAAIMSRKSRASAGRPLRAIGLFVEPGRRHGFRDSRWFGSTNSTSASIDP
jgi:hypothetical protein